MGAGSIADSGPERQVARGTPDAIPVSVVVMYPASASFRPRFGPAALALAAALVAAPASVASERGLGRGFDLEYGLRLAGLPIGRATLKGGLGEGRYRLDLDARLTGLAGWVAGIGGNGTSHGAAAGRRVIPSSYAVNIPEGRHPISLKVDLSGGNVVEAMLSPPLQPRPDRIPVLDTHKRGVVDPVGALLMLQPGRGPVLDPEACNRTLPIFDGAGRFDVRLTYASTKAIRIPGYEGPALVCAARYVPIAGHRERSAVQFMRENRDMEAWLVPVAGARALVPARITVGTRVGRLVIEARRIGGLSGTITAAAEPEDEARGETAASPDPGRRR